MQRQSVCVAIVVYAVAAWAASAAADMKTAEPTGFGKAKFGMSRAQVGKLVPKVHPNTATAAAEGKGAPLLMAIYEVEDQSVGPLKKCRAEFRFFKDELYEVQFRCPDRVKVGQYLQKTYGLPDKMTENAVFWMGKHSAVSLSPKSGAFAFGDRERSQAMQSVLFASMQKSGQALGAAPEAAAPGATPAAPETAPAAPPHE